MARKDLSAFGLAKGGVRKLTKSITVADLTAEAAEQSIACGTIPTGALVLGVEVDIQEAFDTIDADDAFQLDDITVGGTEIGLDDRVDENTSLDTQATFSGSVFLEVDGAVLATIVIVPDAANDLTDATDGNAVIKIYYVEGAVEQPS